MSMPGPWQISADFPLQASASALGRDAAPSSLRECSAASRLPSLRFSFSVASLLLGSIAADVPKASSVVRLPSPRRRLCGRLLCALRTLGLRPSAVIFFLRLSGGFSSSTKPSAGLIPELTLSCVSRRPFAFLSSPFAALLVQVFFRFLAVSLLCCFSPPVALASLLLQAALRVSPEGNWESLLFKSAPWAWPLLRSRILSFSFSWVGLSI